MRSLSQPKTNSKKKILREYIHTVVNQKLKVLSVDEGMRVDRFLRNNLRCPQSVIEKFIREKKIVLQQPEDKTTKLTSNFRIKQGQTILIKANITKGPNQERVSEKQLSDETIKKIRSWIIHKDKDIIVINKPQGVVVQGSGDSIAKMLPGIQYKDPLPPLLVHRLDKETTGILVIARNRKVAEIIANDFKNQKVQKLYWAIVIGIPKKEKGILRSSISEKKDQNFVFVDEKQGSNSATAYTVIDTVGNQQDNKFSFLALKPFSGRKHQLRVHCASELQTPILGDEKYGPDELPPTVDHLDIKGLQLHAREIMMIHPTTKKIVSFVSPIPKHMVRALESFGFSSTVNHNLLQPSLNSIEFQQSVERKVKISTKSKKT